MPEDGAQATVYQHRKNLHLDQALEVSVLFWPSFGISICDMAKIVEVMKRTSMKMNVPFLQCRYSEIFLPDTIFIIRCYG
jgi:hypothetical protein